MATAVAIDRITPETPASLRKPESAPTVPESLDPNALNISITTTNAPIAMVNVFTISFMLFNGSSISFGSLNTNFKAINDAVTMATAIAKSMSDFPIILIMNPLAKRFATFLIELIILFTGFKFSLILAIEFVNLVIAPTAMDVVIATTVINAVNIVKPFSSLL